MSKYRRFSNYASIVAIGTALMATPAIAQDDQQTADTSASDDNGGAVPSIVVTARKRSERLLDVPETITAISSDTLKKAGINDLNDLGKTLPNVVLARRADNEPNVVIRGIGSFGNVQGIGFYVDDVQTFFDASARLVDLERVEVLKGPQGTLYGGNSIGGAVKYITRKPGPYAEGSAALEAGGQDIFDVSASANIPFSDTVFLRVSGYSATNNGYMFNPVLGENTDASKEGGVRAALRIRPDDRTDINISGRVNFLENGNDYQRVTATDQYDKIDPDNVASFDKRRVWSIAADITRDFGPATLTSITAYSDRWSRFLWGFDYGPLDENLYSQPTPYHGKYFSQELRLTSNGDGPFGWIVGGFYSRLRDRNTVLHGDVRIGVDAGEAFPGAPVPLIIEDFFNATTLETTYAGFVNLTYESGGFGIDAGARLHNVNFEGTELFGGTSANVEDTVVLPKLTLSYQTESDILFYATVSQGYEPGRVTIGNFLNAGFLAPYKPEKSTNYEIGVKGETADRKLQFELAGFHITYKDRQFETSVRDDLGNVQELIDNIGQANVWGVEGSITARPTPELTINASAGYLDSKWKNAVYFLETYDGNRTPFSPEFTAKGSIDYTLPVSENYGLNLRADVTYSGSFYWDIPNLFQQDAYAVVGLRAAFSPNDGPWEIYGRVQNLFDTGYNDELIPNNIAPGIHIAQRGQPRLFTAGVSYEF